MFNLLLVWLDLSCIVFCVVIDCFSSWKLEAFNSNFKIKSVFHIWLCVFCDIDYITLHWLHEPLKSTAKCKHHRLINVLDCTYFSVLLDCSFRSWPTSMASIPFIFLWNLMEWHMGFSCSTAMQWVGSSSHTCTLGSSMILR